VVLSISYAPVHSEFTDRPAVCYSASVPTRTACLVLLSALPSFATWSLGILDPATRNIAVAGASCSPSVYGVAGVVPGTGLVFAQAASNMQARDRAMDEMRRGTRNEEILRQITAYSFDANASKQQYALLTFAELDHPVTFTGDDTPPWHGVFSTRAITVQGNTLVSRDVLWATYSRLVQARWKGAAEMAEIAVAALAAGSDAGGDSRCGATRASSAFVSVFQESDSPQSPTINVVVPRSQAGGRNAVDVLRERLTKR
jgi:uncharacterized Ntn-hydrolase superfamily protein